MIELVINRDQDAAEQIRKYRELYGLSLTKLADRAGVSVSALSLYESGKRVPSVEAYNKILGAMGVKVCVIKEG